MDRQVETVARLAQEAPGQLGRILSDARRRLGARGEPLMSFALHTQGAERHALHDINIDNLKLYRAAEETAHRAYETLTGPGPLSETERRDAERTLAEAAAVFEEPHTAVVIVESQSLMLVYWEWRYAFTASRASMRRDMTDQLSHDTRWTGVVPLPDGLDVYRDDIIDLDDRFTGPGTRRQPD